MVIRLRPYYFFFAAFLRRLAGAFLVAFLAAFFVLFLVAFFAALRFAGAFLAADLRFFAAIVFLLIEVLLTYGLG